MRCTAKNARGEPCRAPNVGADGLCPAHRVGSEGMAERGRLGGKATTLRNKLPGLPATSELLMGADWTLETVPDAQRWLWQISLAVMSKRLDHNQASVIVRAIEAWLRSHDSVTRDELDELKAMAKQALGGHTRPVAV